MATLLYGLKPYDPAWMLVAIVLLAAIAPATLEPMTALRNE